MKTLLVAFIVCMAFAVTSFAGSNAIAQKHRPTQPNFPSHQNSYSQNALSYTQHSSPAPTRARRLSERENNSSRSTRVSGRGIKGLLKLGALVLIVLFGIGGWVIKQLGSN